MKWALIRAGRWFRDWWMRRRLQDVLKEALLVLILDAVYTVLVKDYASAQRVKSAARSALKQLMTKLRLPEAYEKWIAESTSVVLDDLIDRHLPDRARVMRELEAHLRELLGVGS